jgi:dipeptidase E
MKFYLSSFRLGDNPERLVELLTTNKKAAVIVNAIDDATEEIRKEKLEREISELATLGIVGEELDLRNYFDKKVELKERLSEYGMVWIRGGNTFILRRAYRYSGFDELLKEKIGDKDFVYGGYSAAVCILAPSLNGLDIVDDPNIVPRGYQEDIIWEGLGFLDYTIAPHYRSEHPESAGVEKEVQYCIDNKILFKALRDGEVLLDTSN